jgi:DNA-binding beta-propeller fold protein YncE
MIALWGSLLGFPLVYAAPAVTLFESGQVRPLALAPSGALLFAANTPDNRLEVFRVTDDGHLVHRTSVPVGLEPVAIAARSDSEVWVVNHLSDSVSVVKLGSGGSRGRVVRTLLVGDEPRDIVFGGPEHSRAFITTAHRGQNLLLDP